MKQQRLTGKISPRGSQATPGVGRGVWSSGLVPPGWGVWFFRGVFGPSRARFCQEAVVADLVRHPSLVRLLDVFYEAERVHLVYELAASDLKRHMASLANGTLEPGQIRDCLQQLLSGLSHLHGKGLVHTDVKSDNIFVKSPRPWHSILGDLGSTVEVRVREAGLLYWTLCLVRVSRRSGA